jgi:hypothetical protein
MQEGNSCAHVDSVIQVARRVQIDELQRALTLSNKVGRTCILQKKILVNRPGVSNSESQGGGVANYCREPLCVSVAAYTDVFLTGIGLCLLFPTFVSQPVWDTSYRVEAFYRYKLTDNISLTPGFFMLFNPEHNDANDTIYVGTFLTTFTF